MGFWQKLQSTFASSGARQRAEEEARFHLEMKAAAYEEQGLSPQEAHRRARREFGNLLQMQEATGDQDLFAGLEALSLDVRVAWRRLRRSPVFLVSAVALLAFGIGVNTAVFSVVDHLLIRPLPLPGSERLFVMEESRAGQVSNSNPLRLADWGARVPAFEVVASQYGEVVALDDGQGRRGVPVLRAVGDWLGVLGLQPIEGRNFTAGELQGENVALLTESGRRYGRVGSRLRLGDGIFAVVGIVPDAAVLGERTAILTPAPASVLHASRKAGFLSVVARLRNADASAAASAQMQAAAASLAKDFPATDQGLDVRLVDARSAWTKDLRSSAWLLQAASFTLLLITIANLAALLAARTLDRSRESAIRGFLGASRWSILRLHLVEAGLVSFLGCLAAALVAVWALAFLQESFAEKFPPLALVQLDTRVFAYLFALGLASALLCTLVMAWQSSLSKRPAARQRPWLRAALVVLESALGLLLLMLALGLAGELAARQARPLGFAQQRIVVASVDLPWSADHAELLKVMEGGLERFAALPGVSRVGLVDRLPLHGGTQSAHALIRGLPEPTREEVGFRMASSSYFATMGIPLLAGAPLGEADAVVVNDALSRRYFNGHPIGRYISNDGQKFWRIAGVVGSVRKESNASEAQPEVWLSYRQWSWPKLEFVLETSQSPSALAAPIRKLVGELSSLALLEEVAALEDRLARVDLEPRRQRDVLSLFGFVALCLVVAGVYGVMAGESLRRTREMGIRLAVGASPSHVFALIFGHAAQIAAASLAVGLALALSLPRAFAQIPTVLAAAATIALAILLAAAGPAWRASRTAPSHALRTE